MRPLVLSLLLSVLSLGPAAPTVRAANVPLSCTNHQSLTRAPETIRVLRTSSGRVEVVPFKLYVYRTHVAEFWSEYKSTPYSDALLGVGAIAIKQNAWLWARSPRDWWASSSTTATQRGYVEADYADDKMLNGSNGDLSTSRTERASDNAAWALRMRIRYGADRSNDGIGGLVWDAPSRTYTAPLTTVDESGTLLPLTSETPRSCFDVTDHPSINQFYRPGGIYDPGYEVGGRSNARYNRAVDATWGLTVRRWYQDRGEYLMWRPGFYGSLNSSSACQLPPEPGASGAIMRHLSQPSHWRGWSFFPVNAESCARERGLSTDELLRASFFSWDGTMTAGDATSSIADDRYRVDWVRAIRVVSPAADASGDGRGDLLAFSQSGLTRIISADPRVDLAGRLDGTAAGAVLLAPGETLIERVIGRTELDGSLAVIDLRRAAGGVVTLVVTPISGGRLGGARELLGGTLSINPAATLSLQAADTTGDGVDELFLSERTVSPLDPTQAQLRLYRIAADGSAPSLLTETDGGADLRTLVSDFSGDGLADLLFAWRDREGTLVGSLALSTGTTPWAVGAPSSPGALLWPIPSEYRFLAVDALADGASELYLQYRDPAGTLRIVRLNLKSADPAASLANPDLVYVAEREPASSTRVVTGEPRLRYLAQRTGLPLAQLVALNSGGSRSETIRPRDTYAKIATRTARSEACLRTMNGNRILYRGKTLQIPLDLCVIGAKSVLYKGTPIRIRAADLISPLAGESSEALIARLATLGVASDLATLTALNPGTDLTLLSPTTPLRLRAPWAPVARQIAPPGLIVNGGRTLGWSTPVEVYQSTSKSNPLLLAREWTGDGLIDLFLQYPATTGGTTLQRLGYQDGRLIALETITRSFLLSGWSLR